MHSKAVKSNTTKVDAVQRSAARFTYNDYRRDIQPVSQPCYNKSSAGAEMGDHGHNRHGLKGGSVLCPFRGALGTRLIHSLWSARRSILPYQVASSTIQLFGHNSAGIQDRQRTDSIGQTVLQTVAQKLQWDSLQHLQQRRARSRVLMLYRIRNGLVAIPALIYLEPTVVHTRGFETSYRQS